MRFKEIMDIVLPALPETIIMILVPALIALIIGLPWGILSFVTRPKGLRENKFIYTITNGLINIFRSCLLYTSDAADE